MLTLPFHVERPLETALIVGFVALAFAFLWWAYGKNLFRVRDVLSAYFRRRLGSLGPEKADSAARLWLASLSILFACMAVFGFSVASGIIKNGAKQMPPVSEEAQMLQEYLGGGDGTIDVKELVRQHEAARDESR
jgi:hypothetical protein